MLSPDQRKLIKIAQRELGLPDEEYRDTLQAFFGVTSCTAPELEDRHFDKLLAFWEAVYWREVERQHTNTSASALPIRFPSSVFNVRGYWAAKNTARETSRDRFTRSQVQNDIAAAEAEARRLGMHPNYYGAIRKKIPNDYHYLAALKRLIKSRSGRPQETLTQ